MIKIGSLWLSSLGTLIVPRRLGRTPSLIGYHSRWQTTSQYCSRRIHQYSCHSAHQVLGLTALSFSLFPAVQACLSQVHTVMPRLATWITVFAIRGLSKFPSSCCTAIKSFEPRHHPLIGECVILCLARRYGESYRDVECQSFVVDSSRIGSVSIWIRRKPSFEKKSRFQIRGVYHT